MALLDPSKLEDAVRVVTQLDENTSDVSLKVKGRRKAYSSTYNHTLKRGPNLIELDLSLHQTSYPIIYLEMTTEMFSSTTSFFGSLLALSVCCFHC
jgi:hypothetical protein